jgi:DNA-binding MarR family transcriptional regulator
MAFRSLHSSLPLPGELSTVDGLVQLSFLIHGRLERLGVEHDLSITQMRLLGVLRDRRPSMNELATLLSLDKSSVTGLVDRAERRGLVTRTTSNADRRSILVSLTKKGRTRVSKTATRLEADVSTILDCLPASERAVFSSLVSRILVAHAIEVGVDLFPADTAST